MNLLPGLTTISADMQTLRRDIHAHPELKFEEHRTSELVAQQLESYGIAVTRGLAGTGLVGTLVGNSMGNSVGTSPRGVSPRAIGLRADMDALPLQEHNSFAHASQHPGKMHACGHDGHTAMLLAAAAYLSRHRDFDGTVHFIFQPAEEGGAGAQRMIEDGLFERFPCDAVFALHNWPGLAVGNFGVRVGALLAGSAEFDITVTGKGAHAAMPNLGIDPVMVACQIAQALQLLISREKKPLENAVLSITQIHAGDAYNVIPDQAVMRGTVRAFSVEEFDRLALSMRRVIEHTAAAFNASAEFRFQRNYPPTINHAHETEFAARVMESVVGADHVVRDYEPTMGAEDFAFMLLQKPGCYAFIGNGEGAHRHAGHGLGPCMLHNPSYDFNDELIPLGATYWVKLVQAYLA